MKVTLTKKISLHSAFVFLKLKKMEVRSDIQDYLNGKKTFDNDIIENRLKDYFRNIGIYDEKHQLTSLGRKVKETGKYPTEEAGKYQIWYSQNDSYWGNRIFFFKRVRPQRSYDQKKDTEQLPLNLDMGEHFLLQTNNNPFSTFELLPLENGYTGESLHITSNIHFTWQWDNLESSSYSFHGKINGGPKTDEITLVSHSIVSDRNLENFISKILPEWNNKANRYGVRVDYINEESKKTFEEQLFVSKWIDFNVEIQNLPLAPYDIAEALKWRNLLLTDALKKEYYSPSDFERKTIELNTKEALAIFHLDKPEAGVFAKQSTKTAFWHLQTPMDLNPNVKMKLSAKSIGLKQGEKISFANIVKNLGIGKCAILVYYDRYVCNLYQHKAVYALTQAIDAEKNFVITDLTPKDNSSDFIQKNAPKIIMQDIKSIFKAKNPHDRYLIAVNKNEMTVWNVSNSIDYLSFLDAQIQAQTIGVVQQSVVFTPIDKEMLAPNLLQFIQNIQK